MKLLGIAEIADIANVSRQAVSNWVARDDTFPKPVASLACGEIFAADTVVHWLKMNRKLPGMDAALTLRKFKSGEFYTHAEINAAFGGNPMAYLRIQGGQVCCGCFNSELNPNAPEEILVGTGPQIERSAELLMTQGGKIPVFVKRGTNQWQYQGEMRPVSLEKSSSIVTNKANAAGQRGISAVLTLART